MVKMNENEPLKLIHITDLHFFCFPKKISQLLNKRILGCFNWKLNRKRRFDFEAIDQFLNILKAYKNAVVLVSGDLTVTALEEEFYYAKKFIDKIKDMDFPVFVIPGNHDYYTYEAVRKKRCEKILSEYIIPNDDVAMTYLSDNTPLIFLHTVRPNFLTSRGEISLKQIQQLKDILQKIDKPTVICAHYPVLHHTPEYYSSYSRKLENSNHLREVLIQTKVPLLYVAGHVHHYSLSRDRDNPLVQYLISPALFYNCERNGGFSEITIQNGEFHVSLKSIYE